MVKVAHPVAFSKDFVIGLALAISSSLFIGTRSEFSHLWHCWTASVAHELLSVATYFIYSS